jgi:hypothetical protein
MTLPLDDPQRAGFIEGERTLATQILALIDDDENAAHIEEEMLLGR